MKPPSDSSRIYTPSPATVAVSFRSRSALTLPRPAPTAALTSPATRSGGADGVCEGVQFVMGGLHVPGDGVTLLYGLQDCEAGAAHFSISELSRLLAYKMDAADDVEQAEVDET